MSNNSLELIRENLGPDPVGIGTPAPMNIPKSGPLAYAKDLAGGVWEGAVRLIPHLSLFESEACQGRRMQRNEWTGRGSKELNYAFDLPQGFSGLLSPANVAFNFPADYIQPAPTGFTHGWMKRWLADMGPEGDSTN
jgi:hypothetical protein